jgi:hypothetical protein
MHLKSGPFTHAVAALRLNFFLTRLAISPDDPDNSYCHIDFPKGAWPDSVKSAQLMDYLVFVAAGAEAERQLLQIVSVGDSGDREQANRALDCLAKRGLDRQLVYRDAGARVRIFVRDYAASIEKVAFELGKHLKLDANQVRALCA